MVVLCAVLTQSAGNSVTHLTVTSNDIYIYIYEKPKGIVIYFVLLSATSGQSPDITQFFHSLQIICYGFLCEDTTPLACGCVFYAS